MDEYLTNTEKQRLQDYDRLLNDNLQLRRQLHLQRTFYHIFNIIAFVAGFAFGKWVMR